MTNQSHTELAAQARKAAERLFNTNDGMYTAIETLNKCAAVLESTERVLGGLPEHCTSGNCPCIKCPRATSPTAPTQHAQVEHRPGCEALGGYGHGVGPCSCGATTPSPQAEKQPLSDEQHRAIWERESRDWAEGRNDNPYLAYGKAVERAHGVTTKENT